MAWAKKGLDVCYRPHALGSNPGIGLAHCYYLDVDEGGSTTIDEFRQRRTAFRRQRPVELDYRNALGRSASYANALRTYRRSTLRDLGGFNEKIPFGIDYDMALRVLEQHEIRLVPEFLYFRRLHSHNTTESLRWKRYRMWFRKYWIRRALFRGGQITYWSDARFDLAQFLAQEWRIFRERIRSSR